MKKHFRFVLLAMAALGVVACSDDDLTGGGVLEQDETRYVTITFGSPTERGTRAEGDITGSYDPEHDYNPEESPKFEEGTNDENEISDVRLVFYDENGIRINLSKGSVIFIDGNDLTDELNTPEESPNITQRKVAKQEITFKKGEKMPRYVLAFVNATHGNNLVNGEEFSSLTNAEKALTELLFTSDSKFPMSNTVYYSTDDGKLKVMAQEITETDVNKFFGTKEEAQELYESLTEDGKTVSSDNKLKALDIYVERYAVKVNLKITENNPVEKENESGDKYTFTFTPEAWAINAGEERTFVLKTYFQGAGYDPEEGFTFTEPYSYAGVNGILNNGGQYKWMWNDAGHYRSYWAQSPGYYISKYPLVSDDIKDVDYTWAPGDKGGYPLKYYSYSEIIANAGKNDGYKAKAKALNGTAQTTLYTMENTVGKVALGLEAVNGQTNGNPKAAIPSIVLVGQYKIKKNGESESTSATFYKIPGVEKDIIYPSTEEIEKMYLNDLKESLLVSKLVNGVWTDPVAYTKEDGDVFVIDHPNKEARQANGVTAMDSRYVLFQLDKEKFQESAFTQGQIKLVYPKSSANGTVIYQEIVAGEADSEQNQISIDEVNGSLISWLTWAEKFSNGRAYFYIPITHLGFFAHGHKKWPTDKDFNWNELHVGDFGLVRNHVYSIEVAKISDLGTGLLDETTPIVPPADEEVKGVVARVNILNWAIVPAQHVEF